MASGHLILLGGGRGAGLGTMLGKVQHDGGVMPGRGEAVGPGATAGRLGEALRRDGGARCGTEQGAVAGRWAAGPTRESGREDGVQDWLGFLAYRGGGST